MSLGMISSHSNFCRHSSCINSLGSNVNGVSVPKGSSRELINANIPLLVSSNTLSIGLIDSRSVSKFHKIPSTFSVCTWFSEIFGDISEYGKVSKNDLSLDSHFVNLKPPFDNTLIIVLAVVDNFFILECELKNHPYKNYDLFGQLYFDISLLHCLLLSFSMSNWLCTRNQFFWILVQTLCYLQSLSFCHLAIEILSILIFWSYIDLVKHLFYIGNSCIFTFSKS